MRVAASVASAAGPVTGAPREVYWTDYFSAAQTDEVCDVAWPVR